MDEEFPEFQTLLDAMADEVPPITLPCLPPLPPLGPGTHPASSGQKRRAGGEQAGLPDTGATGSGAHSAKHPVLITGASTSQVEAPEMENDDDAEPPTRDEAITAFVASPLLPEPENLVIGHISALMALMSVDNGPTRKQAAKLLSLEYDLPTANLIWEVWAPYIVPPEGDHAPRRGEPRKELCHHNSTQTLPHKKPGQSRDHDPD